MSTNKPNKPTQAPHSHWLHMPKFLSHSGQKPNRNARINFVVIAAILVFCLADLAVSAATMGRMFPGVSIAGRDVSFLTRAQAYQTLKGKNLERNFTIKVGEKVFNATSAQLGAHYDVQTTVDTAYTIGHDQPLPILAVADGVNDGSVGYAYSIDQTKLKEFTSSIIQSVGHDAVNANLQVTNGVVEVVPDQDGLRVDQKYLNKVLATALSDAKDQSLSLEPTIVKADILASGVGPAKAQAENLLAKNITLTYEGRSFTADRSVIGHMIVFSPAIGPSGKLELQASVSPEQVAGYVQSVANQINIAPVNKKVLVANGTSNVEREGKDGLAISQSPAINAIVAGLNANSNVSVNLTASPVAFKTETNQSGALGGLANGSYIEVSLGSQRLWAWQDGQVIFSTPVTSGASGYGFGTSTGLFSIYAKEHSRYLNGGQYGWNYNVFVDFWMPFNGGTGLHDADRWRSSYGGQDYIMGGSHGCVNMSYGSAAFLFGWAGIGTPVWVHG